MSDLWITAGDDAEAELHLRYLTHARTAAASSIGFALGAQSEDEFVHRSSLISGALDEACQAAVGPDTHRFLDVRVALLAELEDGFTKVHQARLADARRKEAAAAERKRAEARAKLNAEFAKLAAGDYYTDYVCPHCGHEGSDAAAGGKVYCSSCAGEVPKSAQLPKQSKLVTASFEDGSAMGRIDAALTAAGFTYDGSTSFGKDTWEGPSGVSVTLLDWDPIASHAIFLIMGGNGEHSDGGSINFDGPNTDAQINRLVGRAKAMVTRRSTASISRTAAQTAEQGAKDGKAAFEAGQPRIAPFADDGTEVGSSGYADYARAWYRAWDAANLAAPVGGDYGDEDLTGGGTTSKTSAWSEDDDEFDDEEIPEGQHCPVCGGAGQELGTLGHVAHYRCRDCGWDWSHDYSDGDGQRYPQADDLSFESAKLATDMMDSSGATTQLPVQNAGNGDPGVGLPGTDNGSGQDDSPDSPYGITSAKTAGGYPPRAGANGMEVWLQDYGYAPAKPVSELKPGDTILYNFGIKGKVIEVRAGAGQSATLVVEENGKQYESKKKLTTLVAVAHRQPRWTREKVGEVMSFTATAGAHDLVAVDSPQGIAWAVYATGTERRLAGGNASTLRDAQRYAQFASQRTAAVAEECANCGHAIDVDGGVWYHVRTGLPECQDRIPAPPTDAATPTRSGREASKKTAGRDLNDIMEFDHVIRVHEDGSVTDEPGVYAPSLMDDQLDDPRWEFFTKGYSGQYGYNGPIMHNSEFIGGQLEQDILATPGVYAAVISDYSPEEEDGELESEGWAVVRLKD